MPHNQWHKINAYIQFLQINISRYYKMLIKKDDLKQKQNNIKLQITYTTLDV